MELVGLARDVVARPIGAMSGGQFQRLLVAFALVGKPNVLLLDEPTAGVDEPGEERLNELVHRLQHEEALTVLLISHELSVVYRYADNVLCLGGGDACFGPPREVLTPDVLRADLRREVPRSTRMSIEPLRCSAARDGRRGRARRLLRRDAADDARRRRAVARRAAGHRRWPSRCTSTRSLGAVAMLFFGELLVWALERPHPHGDRNAHRHRLLRLARRRQHDGLGRGSDRSALRRARPPPARSRRSACVAAAAVIAFVVSRNTASSWRWSRPTSPAPPGIDVAPAEPDLPA